MKLTSFLAAAVAAAAFAPTSDAQNLLANPDFEAGGLAGWSVFGNALPGTANPPSIDPLSGNELCSLFGNFSGGFDVSGIFQEFPCNPGDQFFLDAWARHWSGDPLTGTGVDQFNWVVMKIAFFDAFGVEITSAAVESVILDGTFATDVWHDPNAILATAPIGVATVQPLILFLQPFDDPGAAQIDDVFFGPGLPIATYPGTGEDLALLTGLNGAVPTGPGDDVKTVSGGDFLEVNINSPGGTFDYASYFLLGQTFLTGSPPLGFANIWIDLASPYFLLVSPTPSTIGAPLLGPNGVSHYYQMPGGLSGFSFMIQAFPFSPAAANGVFAISDAHEIRF